MSSEVRALFAAVASSVTRSTAADTLHVETLNEVFRTTEFPRKHVAKLDAGKIVIEELRNNG